ncbi:MAG: OmpW family protein [Proteobacteria bacterium]|nr:OmpW family protein [Pseudomonadota bacterium]
MVPSLAAAALLALALPAAAEDTSDWLIRARAIDVSPNASSSIPGLDVGNQWAPELDFSWFMNRNLSLELILATTRHEVTLNGQSLGKVSVLPPTVLLQYHFTDLGAFQPYVGGGLNVSWFYNAGLKLPDGTPLGVSNTSVGGALQAGIDYYIDKHWLLNADVKYIWMNTDVTLPGGATLTKLDIDPWVYGVGVGYRF